MNCRRILNKTSKKFCFPNILAYITRYQIKDYISLKIKQNKTQTWGLCVRPSEWLELETRNPRLEQGSPRVWQWGLGEQATQFPSLWQRSPAGKGNELGKRKKTWRKRLLFPGSVAPAEGSLEEYKCSCKQTFRFPKLCFQTQTLVVPATWYAFEDRERTIICWNGIILIILSFLYLCLY